MSTVHTTNLHNQEVFHKLTERQERAWLLPGKVGQGIRRGMASALAKMYPKNGCGICSSKMKLIAYVSPRGELRMLVAPFRVIPIHAIANKPAVRDCPCLEFWDPEIRGPWRARSEGERARYGGHHPMCQYKPTAARVFAEVFQAKNGGVVIDTSGKAVRERERARGEAARPDLMLRIEQKVRQS